MFFRWCPGSKLFPLGWPCSRRGALKRLKLKLDWCKCLLVAIDIMDWCLLNTLLRFKFMATSWDDLEFKHCSTQGAHQIPSQCGWSWNFDLSITTEAAVFLLLCHPRALHDDLRLVFELLGASMHRLCGTQSGGLTDDLLQESLQCRGAEPGQPLWW